MLRRIFGPKREKVIGEWRRLHKKELYAVYSSPNVIQTIKLRILKWAGHVVRVGRGEMHTGSWWGNRKGGDHLDDPGIDGRIILK